MQTSFIAVKPEMLGRADDMAKIIVANGLAEVRRQKVLVNENQFLALYGHIKSKPRIFKKMRHQLVGRYILVILFRGEHAIDRIVKIVGEKSYAHHNKPGTLRAKFGNRERGYYHHNAVHRPKSEREVHDHLQTLNVPLQ